MYSYLYSKINRNKNEIGQLNSTHFFILYAPNQFQIFPKSFPKIFTQLPVHITTKFLTQYLLTLSYHNQNPYIHQPLSQIITKYYPNISTYLSFWPSSYNKNQILSLFIPSYTHLYPNSY